MKNEISCHFNKKLPLHNHLLAWQIDSVSNELADMRITKISQNDKSPAIAGSIGALLHADRWRGICSIPQIMVGIDLDSTIAKIDEPWLARLNKSCHTNYHPNQWTDWNLSFLNEEERKVFFKVFTPDIYESVKPYRGAIESIKKLAGIQGIKLICVTTNPSHNENAFAEAKKNWLRYYFPNLADSVVFSKKKSGLGLDILVDDAPHHFQDVDFIPILVERPWNKSVDCALRFKDWSAGTILLRSLIDKLVRTAMESNHFGLLQTCKIS